MGHVTTIAALEAAAAAAIAQLDATAHRLASGGVVTWRESELPLTATEGSALESHLLFSVSVESAPATGTSGPGYIEVAPELLVAFLYKVPAGGKLAASRLASDAAIDIVRTMLSDWSHGDVTTDVLDAYSPGALRGDFLPVEVRLSCLFDLYWET